MKKAVREKRIDQFFRLGIFLKGIHAALEIVGGFLIIFISPSQVTKFVVWITQGELAEDPQDFVSNYLLHFAERLSLSNVLFGAFYLLSHGIIKLILVIELLKNRLWAYPWALAIFSLFTVYLIYRYILTHSLGIFFLSLFDLIVIWLVWCEYKIARARHKT